MIQWTKAGAVANALTVQIRVNQGHASRIGVGAPVPRRDLTTQELRANIHHFVVARNGPRTAPCTGLVLSGSKLLARGDLDDAVCYARSNGVERVVIHGDWTEVDALCTTGLADEVVVSVLDARDLDTRVAPTTLGSGTTVVIALNHQVLGELRAVLSDVVALKPARIVLTWPFSGVSPPTVDAVVQAVHGLEERLATQPIQWGLKNLPPCQLQGGDLSPERIWRSGNRWYVDADHQTDKALLFFPEVVRFHKGDSCRYCTWDRNCDGVTERWFREGLTKPLQPL